MVVILVLLAVLTAGCYDKADYELTADDVNRLLSLTSENGRVRLAADGFSELRLVARLLDESDEDRRSILFTTTEGSFDATEDLKEKTVDADADGVAFVDLRSSEMLGPAQVQAQVVAVPGLLQQLRIDFVAVSTDSIISFVAAPGSARADGLSLSTFTVVLNPEIPADKRMIAFKTTAGTFVGSGAAEEMVDAATRDQVSVQLKSPMEPGTAQVTATVNKATAVASITFSSVDPDTLVRFTRTTDSAPADGATRSAFTVRISGDIPADQKIVAFKTTAGTFAVSGGPEEMVQAAANDTATAQLLSPLTLTTARVSATAAGVTREATIRFFRAYTDKAVQVTAEPLELIMDPLKAGPQATVVTMLLRNLGTVTPGSQVTFSAVGINNQRVGFFSNVTLSDDMGQVVATYIPGSTTYRGEVTLRAAPEGTSLVGSTIVRLVDPPPD